MAYFPNGTTGQMWEEDNCDKCDHQLDPDQGKVCPVMELHEMWNNDQSKDETKSIALNILIPRSEDKLHNNQCAMFQESSSGYAG